MESGDIDQKPIWPARWWWAALLVILLVAGGLRYTGYNFSLPYIDHLDEPSFNISASMILSIGTARPQSGHDAYPPGIITLNYLLLRWFHDPAELPSTVIPIIRLMAITAMMGLTVLIALLGYRAATPLAGLVGAALWAVAPISVELSRFATADNFLGFFSVLALFLTLEGVLHNRNRWITAGVFALILAILFKYQGIFIAPVPLLLPLVRLRHASQETRRSIIQNFVDNCAIFGLFLFWLLLLYPTLDAARLTGWTDAYGHTGIPTPDTIYGNLLNLSSSYNPFVLIAALVGLVFLLSLYFRRQHPILGAGVVMGGGGLWLLGISFFGVQGSRHSVAAMALLATMCGMGLVGWAAALEWAFDHIPWPVLQTNRRLASGALVAALALAGSIPQIQDSIANAREHTLHDRRNDLAVWAESTLDPGFYIADRDNHKTFEPFWGGFQGKKYFPLFAMEVVTQRPLEEWRANDVLYAIVPYDAYQQMQTSADGQSYLDQMVLLKSYPPDPRYRGPSMVVFRLCPIQHQATGSLGPIRLLGYDIDRTEVAPGESFTIRYYWQAAQPTDVPYVVFNHLDPLDSFELVAQSDGPPLGESRPTTSWDDTAETILSQPFTITVGEDVPPGIYRLIVGFYRLDTGQRLTTPEGDSFLLVTTIQVKSK